MFAIDWLKRGILVERETSVSTSAAEAIAAAKLQAHDVARRHPGQEPDLDRLSRNVAFLSALMESRVEFVAVDNPHATKLTIHILAAVAEHEREMISQRTKDGLAAAKARNVKLGNPRLRETAGTKGAEKNREKAKAFADNVLPIIQNIERQGAVSLRAIAAELTARKIKTPGGGDEWNPVTVSKIKRRAMA